MCESNVYLIKSGREELLMEKVDRLIPGEDGTIFLENVFGERRIVKAQIKEMELVRHRILLKELAANSLPDSLDEWWMEPLTDHGHFHAGEEVKLKLCKGQNLQPLTDIGDDIPKIYLYKNGQKEEIAADRHENHLLINLGENADGVITVCAQSKQSDRDYYAKTVIEIGHHDHHGLESVGLPLEILPSSYQHAHIGEHYEITVLYQGAPLADVEIAGTYSGHRHSHYPIKAHTDEQGRAKIFLSAKGNYIFICRHEQITSSFTLVKNY